MRKNYIKVGSVVVVVIVAALIAFYLFSTFTSATVTATGQSTLKVQPDESSVMVNVQVENQTAVDAKNSLNEISNSVVESLKSIGLNDSQIQVENYNIYPDYSYENGDRELKGYIAQQSINVVLKDFNVIPNVVDSVVNSGGLVSSINFELSSEKEGEYKSVALENASQDAKEKASAIASGLGKSLGDLVSVENQNFNYVPVVYYSGNAGVSSGVANAGAEKAALNLNPTDVEVTGSVSVTYRVG